jgi:acetylornithine/LysW-gamma-L-lysine aminotransferase
MGSLSATWNRDYRAPFEPLVPGFSHVPYNDLPALEKAITGETAAVLLEVVQGEGGVHRADAGYLHGAAELCRERGSLLILDEVQTGFGRTGRMFACEHYGIAPDLMAVAKSMAGGLPMGACLIGPRVGRLAPMSHGSTFGGNPLACAAGLAAIDALTAEHPAPGSGETLPGRAARIGASFRAQLARIDSPLIREVRGLGLLVGVDLRVKVTPVLQRLQALGVLALPAGPTVLRFLPPLVVSEDDLERVVAATAEALSG